MPSKSPTRVKRPREEIVYSLLGFLYYYYMPAPLNGDLLCGCSNTTK
jgi:hypothetical protein